jgi:prepilin-type N-terminal cleavage/methylation domain-containing protein
VPVLQPRSAAKPPAQRGERGFTLVEALLVLVIIGITMVWIVPNMMRMRIRANTLAQMKQVRQAAMIARMDAIQGGRQTVLALDGNGLIAWRDDGNETRDAGEAVIGRWAFSEKVTVAEDTVSTAPTLHLKTLPGGGRGVVFLASGQANSTGTAGVGQGAFLVSDVRGNRFRVIVQGGSGSVNEEMWDPDTSAWSRRTVFWRY